MAEEILRDGKYSSTLENQSIFDSKSSEELIHALYIYDSVSFTWLAADETFNAAGMK